MGPGEEECTLSARGGHRKKHAMVEAPFSLGDLFGGGGGGGEEGGDEEGQIYEVSSLQFGDRHLRIRQFAYHRANGNQVWPGAFTLSSFLTASPLLEKLQGCDEATTCCILELGAATGALSIFLSAPPFNLKLHTSDIDDGGEVESNIAHNFELNGQTKVRHIAHTWGTGWRKSCEGGGDCPAYKYIIASDILLYVSAYPALVATLDELFTIRGPDAEFIMVWNRRIAQSQQFFELMKQAGFTCHHHGECVFSFRRL